MAALVSNNKNNASSQNPTVTITPTSGNALILGVITGLATTTVNSVTDSKGNTWVRATNRNFLAGIYGTEIWVAYNVAAGATTVTVNLNQSASTGLHIAEFSGLTASGKDLDHAQASTTTTTTPTSGATGTTTQADEVLIGFIGIGSKSTAVITEPTGYTVTDSQLFSGGDYSQMSYKIVSATGAYQYNPTLDVAKTYNAQICTFKIATSGSALTASLTDTVSLAESQVKANTKPLTDSMSLAESASNKPNVILSDSIAIAEVLVNTYGQNLIDSFALADALVKTFGQALSDNVSIADVLKNAPSKPLSDTVTIADSQTGVILTRQLLTDSVTLGDVYTRIVGKGITDTLNMVDSLAKTVGMPLADSVTLAESLMKLARKDFAETLTLVDALTNLIGIKPTDNMIIADVLVDLVGKALADNVSIADALESSLPFASPPARRIYEAVGDKLKHKGSMYSAKGDKLKKKLFN